MTLAQRESQRQRSIGRALVALSLIALLASVFWIMRLANVDFPCGSGLGRQPELTADTSIAYCISLYPRWASGGTDYAVGTSDTNEVVIQPQEFWHGAIELRREQERLYVNGTPLSAGSSITLSRFMPTLNPWIVYTVEFVIRHSGPIRDEQTQPSDALYVYGEANEGWLPNPLGFLILAVGLWLVWRKL